MMNDKNRETKKISELKQKYFELSLAKKIQLISASLISLALVVGLPVFAWFVLGGKLEAFTKIKEPDNLDIRAGHYDDVKYFNLSDIDIEEIASGTPHRVVFSVSAGDYKIPYQLQLAHTTNIPFVYKIYRATECKYSDTLEQPYVTYISMPLKDQGETEADYTFYYTKGDEVTLTAKNPDPASPDAYGRQLALRGDTYYTSTYDTGDTPEIYAVPIYEQSGEIKYDPKSDHDYFILEISWNNTARQNGNFSEWNVAENKKETDMIYLTASRYAR